MIELKYHHFPIPSGLMDQRIEHQRIITAQKGETITITPPDGST
jgi:hypothetical protein